MPCWPWRSWSIKGFSGQQPDDGLEPIQPNPIFASPGPKLVSEGCQSLRLRGEDNREGLIAGRLLDLAGDRPPVDRRQRAEQPSAGLLGSRLDTAQRRGRDLVPRPGESLLHFLDG